MITIKLDKQSVGTYVELPKRMGSWLVSERREYGVCSFYRVSNVDDPYDYFIVNHRGFRTVPVIKDFDEYFEFLDDVESMLARYV